MKSVPNTEETGNEWHWQVIGPLFHRSAQHDRGLKTDAELIAAVKDFAAEVRTYFEQFERTGA